MLTSSWQNDLSIAICNSPNDPARGILFAGVGQESNGDDGVGPAIADLLVKSFTASTEFRSINLGAFPENHLSMIRKLNPRLIVFIDAAQMGLSAGEIRLLSLNEIDGLSAITHSLPFGIIGKYLQDEVGCRVMVLGIQPAHNQPDTTLSRVISDVVQHVSYTLEALAYEYDREKRNFSR